jgi:hypothetical protein
MTEELARKVQGAQCRELGGQVRAHEDPAVRARRRKAAAR